MFISAMHSERGPMSLVGSKFNVDIKVFHRHRQCGENISNRSENHKVPHTSVFSVILLTPNNDIMLQSNNILNNFKKHFLLVYVCFVIHFDQIPRNSHVTCHCKLVKFSLYLQVVPLCVFGRKYWHYVQQCFN